MLRVSHQGRQVIAWPLVSALVYNGVYGALSPSLQGFGPDQPAAVNFWVALEVGRDGSRADVLHMVALSDAIGHLEAAKVVGENQGAAGCQQRHGPGDHIRVIPLHI